MTLRHLRRQSGFTAPIKGLQITLGLNHETVLFETASHRLEIRGRVVWISLPVPDTAGTRKVLLSMRYHGAEMLTL